MVAIAEEIGADINCVVLPIGQIGLLVPSACVAEVLPWRRIREYGDSPNWLLGVIVWRGDSIPVVRFETMNGATEVPSQECECVAVMNRCRTADGPAFYAIATDALPRMLQIEEQDVFVEDAELGVAETAAVSVGRDQLRIPNLAYVEEQLVLQRPAKPTPGR